MKEKEGNIIENLVVDAVSSEGKCISRNNGQVIFISNTAPGDIVDVRITKNKKTYLEAVPIHFHKKSDLRVEPFCSHFEMCGGCKWQHLDYREQVSNKQQQVTDQLKRIGKLDIPEVAPIIQSGKTTLYRNKLEFTFSPFRWLTKEEISRGIELDRRGLGFHAPGRFDKVIDIEQCHLQPEPSNELRLFVKYFCINNDFSFYDVKKFRGFMRNLIIRTTSSGEIMVTIQFAERNMNQIEMLCNALIKEFPEITSLNYVINPKKNDTFFDLDVVHFSGSPFIVEILDGLKFQIGPKSFFQTNTDQALRLYQETVRLASFQGNETVYDLYSGAGTIANFIAGKVKKVVGIEYVAEAVEDAKINSQINSIRNTSFVAGDMRNMIDAEFINSYGSPDVIITDPPRGGMHRDVVNEILAANPERIIYISCNPATQARDLEWMEEKYMIKAVQPVDMFPHTHHVENIVLLLRR